MHTYLYIFKSVANHSERIRRIGYYDGSQQAKVSNDDLHTMYKKYSKGGNLTMWCNGRQTNKTGTKRKNMQDSETTILREKESAVESTFQSTMVIFTIPQSCPCGPE